MTEHEPRHVWQARCRWHFGRCARAFYRDDDPARCPWCHQTWRRIAATGYHSCEDARCWHSADRPRAIVARSLRSLSAGVELAPDALGAALDAALAAVLADPDADVAAVLRGSLSFIV